MRDDDEALAERLARDAGTLLVELRSSWTGSSEALGRRGDLAANEVILAGLGSARPGDAVLSEESVDDLRRLGADRVWIVDPLDGTREYVQRERHDWAVHVALWERRTGGLGAAAVALPALGVTYSTRGRHPEKSSPARPAVDWRDGEVARAWPGDGELRLVVSESRPPPWLGSFVEALAVPVRVTTMGSAGAKAMAVVEDEADAYLHAGGQYEWDSAAPVGVARAAGLHCSRLWGAALEYNQDPPYLPDLLVCRPELAAPLLAAVADTVPEPQGAQR